MICGGMEESLTNRKGNYAIYFLFDFLIEINMRVQALTVYFAEIRLKIEVMISFPVVNIEQICIGKLLHFKIE